MLDFVRLGTNVANRRKKLNLTQAELGEKVATTETYINYIENAKKRPSLDLISNLLDIFHCSIGELFDDS